MRLRQLAGLTAYLVSGCTAAPPAEHPWPVPAADSVRIWTHVVRRIHAAWLDSLPARGYVTCLSAPRPPGWIEGQPYSDPPPALLAGLADLQPPVVPVSECEPTGPAYEYRDRRTGAPGVRLYLVAARRVGTEIKVTAGWSTLTNLSHGAQAVCSVALRFYFAANDLSRVREAPYAWGDCY